jgi:diguanylate cyclase (GGDEF)-like protein
MRIRSNQAVTPAARTQDATRRETAAGSAAAPAGDSATIMGVPEAELTPNVQRALLALMGEVDQLRRETEQLRARIKELENLADADVMLPVLNRRAFLREVSKALALAERHDAPSALIFFDLNGFKAINDTYGHAAGDEALHRVANTLASQVRETDAVGRIGGDEFAVLLTLTPASAAQGKAAELAAAVEAASIEVAGAQLTLKAAWGVQPLERGISADDALAAADAAMYARKQAERRA